MYFGRTDVNYLCFASYLMQKVKKKNEIDVDSFWDDGVFINFSSTTSESDIGKKATLLKEEEVLADSTNKSKKESISVSQGT